MDSQDLACAKSLIDALDLSAVVERLIQLENWSEEETLTACQYYRNYLYLLIKYPHYELPPSKEIDEVWHAHILHTEDYQRFCQAVFGHFLHHQPHHSKNNTLSKEELECLFESQTQKLHYEEFGDYIYAIKPIPLKTRTTRMMKELGELFSTRKAPEESSDLSG